MSRRTRTSMEWHLTVCCLCIAILAVWNLPRLFAAPGAPEAELRHKPQVETAAFKAPDTATKATVSARYNKLPLTFEANQGQTDAQVKFLSRGQGYRLFLTSTEAVLVLQRPHENPLALVTGEPGRVRDRGPAPTAAVVLHMRLLGANTTPEVEGLEELPGRSHYFIGNDPAQWRTNISTYARVQYRDIYPGIDLVYYGNQRQLEYDFVVAVGADPKAIRLAFESADNVEIDTQGDLVLRDIGGGEVRFQKPRIYQEIDGVKQAIPGGYVLHPLPGEGQGKGMYQVGFHVAAYDAGRPLVIDPILAYSTYLGGSGSDFGFGIAVDALGNAYVTGGTSSLNFPAPSAPPFPPFQPVLSGPSDAFITKINPTGSALVYSTYLGGAGGETGQGIAVDAAGNAYVTGVTTSSNFPTRFPLQPAPGDEVDAFIAKLNPTGSDLIYSTYLGGRDDDIGHAIAVDPAGNAYVTGDTRSTDFPTRDPLQPAHGGSMEAFVAKIHETGLDLVYSTYLGGGGFDEGLGIAVDAAGNAYVTGQTNSLNFPTENPLQPALGGDGNDAFSDAFVTKLNAKGSARVYSTFLGGSGTDVGQGIAVDASGNAYVAGGTQSVNFPTFPTANPLQPAFGGVTDAFVAKVNAAGSDLVYSTYLGGSSADGAVGIGVDPAGNAYIAGVTLSTNFPTRDPLQPTFGGRSDAFVAKLDAAGTTLAYSTYLGGNNFDMGGFVFLGGISAGGIAVDAAGNAYVTGGTQSVNFPLANPLQPVFAGGGGDAFVAKISPEPDLELAAIKPIQVIEDVPLVKDKATMVRVFVRMTGVPDLQPVPDVQVGLNFGSIFDDLQSVTLINFQNRTYALPPTEDINAFIEDAKDHEPDERRSLSLFRVRWIKGGFDSVNFLGPFFPRTDGQLTISAHVDRFNVVPEADESNNTLFVFPSVKAATGFGRFVRDQFGLLQSAGVYRIHFYPTQGLTIAFPRLVAQATSFANFVKATYPVPALQGIVFNTPVKVEGNPLFQVNDELVLANAGILGEILFGFDRVVYIMPQGALDTFIVGDLCGFAPDNHVSILIEDGCDNAIRAGEFTLAHEIGHTYSLEHDDDATHPNGGIAANGWDVLGLTAQPFSETRRGPKISASPGNPKSRLNYYSILKSTPGEDAWPTREQYLHLMDRLVEFGRDPRLLIVRGFIFRDGRLFVQPFYVAEGIQEDVTPGDFSLQTLDAAGNVLDEVSFRPNFVGDTATGVDFLFSVTIPVQPEAATILLKEGSTVLREFRKTPTAPTVGVNPVQKLGNGSFEISWNQSDADNDLLHHVIIYSPNGRDFQLLGLDQTGTAFTFEGAGVAPGVSAFMRVITTDGFNTVENFSAPFCTAASCEIFSGGGQREDVDTFLTYAQPLQRSTDLPAGTTTVDVTIIYGPSIDAATFQAALNGAPFAGFTPIARATETVTIPLVQGHNVLLLAVDGRRTDGRTGADRDRLTFIVP